VVAWGLAGAGQTTVPALPQGVSFADVEADWLYSLARRSDGSVVVWGTDPGAQGPVPQLGAGDRFAQVLAGRNFVLARIEPGPACGSVARHCVGAANSASATGARLEVVGCPALTPNDLRFVASGLPPGKLAVLSYGSGIRQMVFGNGWGCLDGFVQLVPGGVNASGSGVAVRAIDLAQPPFGSGPNAIHPGSARSFQLAYRDPAGGPPATFNFTDALHLVFGP
jgi:hypothetical protein